MSKAKFRDNTRSSREIRRIGEREKRREQRKEAVNRFWALTPEERAQRIKDSEMFQRIQRNGITLEDVRNAEDQAYADGAKAGMQNTMKMCYAAACMALRELYGFGRDRCARVLNAMDEKIVYALTSEEMIQEVFDAMKLEIEFNAPIGDRIRDKAEAAAGS